MIGWAWSDGAGRFAMLAEELGDLLATGAIDPLPVYSHEVAWDDAPTALAGSPDKPIVERERLLTSPR